MMLIRPAELRDLLAIETLAGKTGVGVTSLPRSGIDLAARIEISQLAFAGQAPEHDETYLFVLEDTASGRVVGLSSLSARIGLRKPWYGYRVGLAVHASEDLGLYTRNSTLLLTNDHTGNSELSTVFLDPGERRGKNGALLSKSRLLFLAQFRAGFATKVIAEMRGLSDELGCSPFWDSLGRHFFAIDDAEAERLTGAGKKAFIAELMPRQPLYSSFLSETAQAAIAATHASALPARALLEQEGFRFEGYVDIFDAGPVLECATDDIGIIRDSAVYPAQIGESGLVPHLVANTRREGFRCVLAGGTVTMDGFSLSAEVAEHLQIEPGESVRAVPLAIAHR